MISIPGLSLPGLGSMGGLTGGNAGPAIGGSNGPAIWSQGDWNVNVAGSGQAMQGASSAPALSPILIAIVAAVAAWAILRR